MMRRVFAWIALAGFLALVINLVFFRVYWEISGAVYLVIIIAFLLTQKGNGQGNAIQPMNGVPEEETPGADSSVEAVEKESK